MAILTDVSMEEYLASPIPSHHKLQNFAARGPRFYYERHILGTLQYDDSSDAKEFGNAFEMMLCQPRDFDRSFAMKPKDMTFTTKEGKAWRDSMRQAGKQIITEDELCMARGMRDALLSSKVIRPLLEQCAQQVTIRDGDRLQSRPDFLLLEGTDVSGYRPLSIDLKTTKDLNDVVGQRAILSYGYHRQAATVRMTLEANGHPDCACFLLAVSKEYPHQYRLVELSKKYVDLGEKWVREQLRGIEACQAANDWPLADDSILTVDPPPWAA